MKKETFIAVVAKLFIFLFIYTGLSKYLDFKQTWFILTQSPPLRPFALPLAILVPLTELMVSVLLIKRRTRKLGLYGALILSIVFAIYVGTMLLFYDIKHRPCSCGGIVEYLSWRTHFYLNLVLTVLALLAIRWSRKPEGNNRLDNLKNAVFS